MRKPARFSQGFYRIEGEGTPDHPAVPDGVTELRIHGVSGAPPDELLNEPHPLLVSGDDKAAFYRRLGPPEVGPDRTIEAYSWSGISTRSASRAFWLLLFPFAMVNHAGWMVGPKPRGGAERALLRILGLLLTIHYAVGATVVFVDLIGYQCGSSPTCRSQFLLGWLDSVLSAAGPSPIRHTLLLGSVPLFVVLGLFLTARPHGSNEPGSSRQATVKVAEEPPRAAQRQIPSPAAPAEAPPVDTTPLRNPLFWRTPRFSVLLAGSHALAAAAVVGATLARAAGELGRHPSAVGALERALWSAAALATVLVAVSGRATCGGRALRWWGAAVAATAFATGVAIAALAVVSWDAAATARPAVLGSVRRSFELVLVGELAVVMLFYLRDQVRMFFAVPAIGAALFIVLDRPEGAGFPGAGALAGPLWARWMAAAALSAAAGVAVYWLRNRWTGSPVKVDGRRPPDDPRVHLHNPFWISFGLVPVFLAALAGVRAAQGAGTRAGAAVVGAAVCLGYLLVMSRIQIRRAHDHAPRWQLRVGGPATLAAVGAAALTLVSSALIVFAAQRLGPAAAVPRVSAGTGEPSIGYYEELGWIAAGGVGTLIAFSLAWPARLAALWRFRHRSEVPEIAGRLREGGVAAGARDRLAARIARARMYGSLLDDLDWLLTFGVVAFLACSVSVIAGQYLERSAAALDRFVGFASWLVVVLTLLGLWVVRGAQKDYGLRRAIGTLWEITGFFPRRFHPMAPPSYGERSVPELRARLLALTEGHRRVVLLAHSQGALLCYAALAGLLDGPSRDNLRRISLVTYGSMLQRSYGRSFPHLVRVADLVELKAVLEGRDPVDPGGFPPPASTPGWMNLGRNTDYLGGRMFSEPHRPPGVRPEEDRPDDLLFDDPPVLGLAGLKLWGHSFDYVDSREDPRFRLHVLRLLDGG